MWMKGVLDAVLWIIYITAVIPFLFLKYYNEYKIPCKNLWAETYSGFSALKGYRKYILWEVFWPAELSKDRLESVCYIDVLGQLQECFGQCAMATVPTLTISEANVYLLLSCVVFYTLTPHSENQHCAVPFNIVMLIYASWKPESSPSYLCTGTNGCVLLLVWVFNSLECYFQQRQWKQVGCSYFSEKPIPHVGNYLALLGRRIQRPCRLLADWVGAVPRLDSQHIGILLTLGLCLDEFLARWMSVHRRTSVLCIPYISSASCYLFPHFHLIVSA